MTDNKDVLMSNYGNIRNALNDWSLEDIYTLRKAVELKSVDTYWDQMGLFNLTKIQMLASEFRYDALLQRIYSHLLIRVNDRMKDIHVCDRKITLNDLEYMFRDQPFLHAEGEIYGVDYNVHKCKYKKRLQWKYPKSSDLIDDLVMMG